jgi:hypothetical protein
MSTGDDEPTDAELDRQMDLAWKTIEQTTKRLEREGVLPLNVAWALIGWAIWVLAADLV